MESAIAGVTKRFELMESFHGLYGFIYGREGMEKAIANNALKSSCADLVNTLGDMDAEDLEREVLAALNAVPKKEKNSMQILDYIYKNNLVESYPNLSIALRLMITIPVTVASGERSFSRLKLIKTTLRSKMLQKRLSALSQISIEHEITSSLDREELISAFAAAKNWKAEALH